MNLKFHRLLLLLDLQVFKSLTLIVYVWAMSDEGHHLEAQQPRFCRKKYRKDMMKKNQKSRKAKKQKAESKKQKAEKSDERRAIDLSSLQLERERERLNSRA